MPSVVPLIVIREFQPGIEGDDVPEIEFGAVSLETVNDAVQLVAAGLYRVHKPIQGRTVDDQCYRERLAETDLQPVSERQRACLDRQAVGDVDVHHVAHATRPARSIASLSPVIQVSKGTSGRTPTSFSAALSALRDIAWKNSSVPASRSPGGLNTCSSRRATSVRSAGRSRNSSE